MSGVLDELRDVLPDGAPVTDPDVIDPCRRDRAEHVGATFVAATDDEDEGAAAQRRRPAMPVIGHTGGGNLHPLVTFDRHDADAAARADATFDEAIGAGLALGGTVTGEHGIGSLKVRHLVEQLGPDVLRMTKSVKAALYPEGILNPGKWVCS